MIFVSVVYMTPDGTIIQMDDNGNPVLPKTENGNSLEVILSQELLIKVYTRYRLHGTSAASV